MPRALNLTRAKASLYIPTSVETTAPAEECVSPIFPKSGLLAELTKFAALSYSTRPSPLVDCCAGGRRLLRSPELPDFWSPSSLSFSRCFARLDADAPCSPYSAEIAPRVLLQEEMNQQVRSRKSSPQS